MLDENYLCEYNKKSCSFRLYKITYIILLCDNKI